MDVRDALGGRAERYEVMELREEVTTVEYEANRLKTCSVAETSGSALRVVAGGREGFSASTKAGSEERLAAAALESAAYGDEAVFSFAAPAPGARVRCFDSKVADMGVERFAEIGRELVELALAEEPEARYDAGGVPEPGRDSHPRERRPRLVLALVADLHLAQHQPDRGRRHLDALRPARNDGLGGRL